jgi:predicted nucleic acid-binding protein
MARTVLIDSGPLVAALCERDQNHRWARTHFEASDEPFLTCEAVISECLFLLERTHEGKEKLGRLLERGVVIVGYSFTNQLAETIRLIRRYKNTPMSLADACLVRMSERSGDTAVLTTDSDFRVYRRNGRQMIPVIMPE